MNAKNGKFLPLKIVTVEETLKKLHVKKKKNSRDETIKAKEKLSNI